jgi:hypothetical protein
LARRLWFVSYIQYVFIHTLAAVAILAQALSISASADFCPTHPPWHTPRGGGGDEMIKGLQRTGAPQCIRACASRPPPPRFPFACPPAARGSRRRLDPPALTGSARAHGKSHVSAATPPARRRARTSSDGRPLSPVGARSCRAAAPCLSAAPLPVNSPPFVWQELEGLRSAIGLSAPCVAARLS